MTAELVLGIDTSTVVVVALARAGTLLGSCVVGDPRAHAEQLVPSVERVFAATGHRLAELDRIVVGLGPGPFTGLRVGVATAQVLAATLGAALHGVCSLDVIAADHAAHGAGGEFLVTTDARRREVYWARYAADGRRIDGPSVSPPGELPDLPVVGPGAELYAGLLRGVDGPRVLDPAALVLSGPRLPEAGTGPLYLRRPDATEPTRRKPVLLRPARAGR